MIRASELKGFKFHGLEYRVIVSLFADDTTAYLSEKDKYSDLDAILCIWCTASGAKFNISKTRMIPIGTVAYRKHVVETRKISPEQPELPAHVNIAKDGSATICLDVFLCISELQNALGWSSNRLKASYGKHWERHVTGYIYYEYLCNRSINIFAMRFSAPRFLLVGVFRCNEFSGCVKGEWWLCPNVH
jgi:hypothetical protein